MFQANCYVVIDEGSGGAAVIDPGAEDGWLTSVAEKWEVELILLTHAHADHIGGLNSLRQATGAPVYLHASEKDWLGEPELNLSAFHGGPGVRAEPPDQLIHGGETIKFGSTAFEVLHTPGHSPGGVAYLLRRADPPICFSGDTLFYRSVGRSDLPGGDAETLFASIRRDLFTLPPDTIILPGHGPETTVGDEMQYNPFVAN